MPTASLARTPDSSATTIAVAGAATIDAADMAICRGLLANGSRTFLAASYLLPRSVREPACALYAFCRVADDAIDAAPAGGVDAALAALRLRLDVVYRGAPGRGDAIDRAFAGVVRRFAIPRALPEALLEGFAWDAAGRRYESLDELEEYAARVAGTVGAMMALVMQAGSPSALARACDLGVAMQLSNIARDVGDDARAGRIYLPLAWLREAGIDADAWVAAPRHDERLVAVVTRLLARAEALYSRAAAGIAELPSSCRVGINAARYLYAEIGREVARRGCNAIDSRAVVSRRRKAALLARSLVCVRPRARESVGPLAATRHLVEAAAFGAVRAPAVASPDRVVWLIDLFERLERRDRLRHATGAR